MINTILSKLTHGLDVDNEQLIHHVNEGFRGVENVDVKDILEYVTRVCSSLLIYEPLLDKVAVRAQLMLLYQNTPDTFTKTMSLLQRNGKISEKCWRFMQTNSHRLDQIIDHKKDENLSHHGLDTLKFLYLTRDNQGKILERPQYMHLRVAIGVNEKHDFIMEDVELTYRLLSEGFYTHASSTIFAAATTANQMASCYLFPVEHHNQSNAPTTNIEVKCRDVMSALHEASTIMHSTGGVGVSVTDVNSLAPNSTYASVNIISMFNSMVRHTKDWARRPSGMSIYIEPWHNDIFHFLELRKNNGKDEFRCRDLFYALWIPDLFMIRVKENKMWSLMCPSKCPGLSEVYGDEFIKLYEAYENENKYERQVKARDLMHQICLAQIETGNPSVLYKDSANEKSNHKHLGAIKNSNLCTEIIEYADNYNTAVCNLASISLPKFVIDHETFNFDELKFITKIIVRNLNNVIDCMSYPTESCRRSNLENRPIGIGVQGLANVFAMMRTPYESEKAKTLNRQIFEVIYFAALEESCNLAMLHGPYSTYSNSPVSKGLLQFDLWNSPPTELCDWISLKSMIKEYGLRNSLLTALMPTASTAQILGNVESFEPLTSNIYQRVVYSGEYQVINNHLYEDLKSLNLWNKKMVDRIILMDGSIQRIKQIPENIKALYKTVWEMSTRTLIDMSADRGIFIDQSQSFNLYFDSPTITKLLSAHFYSWEKGLKTGMYYLRCKPAAEAQKITCTSGAGGEEDGDEVAPSCKNNYKTNVTPECTECCGC